ncbi:MAG: GGDEF domain-containing protein [Proteobacteria bacterium]|nr:GGDEF domain-containing protein [Pseudomonadota bacterium]
MSPIIVALVAFLLQQTLMAGLWLAVRTRLERRASTQWGLATVAAGAGMTLVALRGHLPPWQGVVLANVLIFVSVGLLARGVWDFTQRPYRNSVHLLTLLGYTALLTVLLATNAGRWLLLAASASSAWLLTLSALATQRGLTTEFGPREARLAALPIWGITLLFVLRTMGLALPSSGMSQPLHTDNTANVVMVLAMMSSGLVLNIALVALVTRRLTRQLEYASHHDDLTGLMNRRRIAQRLDEEFVRQARYPQSHGLLAIDVDHFKRVNDAWGHPTGDKALKAVADCLRQASRGSDSVARVGGEEFWVLMPHITAEDAEQAAQRIVVAVRALRLPGVTTDLRITVSIGVAVAAPSGDDPEALLHRADAALYRAKEAGRDRVVVCHHDG